MQYRTPPQIGFNFGELIVDSFAGGGGASTGIEAALGRPVDIAINHDEQAIAMHTVNHPQTRHYCESVWEVDPRETCQGRPVGLAWFSPDCRHFSKAKGGTPVSPRVRGLAWVVLRWIGTVRPRVVILENVEEFKTWGPVVKVNNDGDYRPCPKRKGNTFKSFLNAIRRHGYQVETRELRACDFGAPTIRKRLFLIARCDGQPIAWPEPTHGPSLQPYRTAADIIDWSIPCPSIFDRKRPLAENTQRRIARGIQRFVIDNPEPFIVRLGHTKWSGDGMQYRTREPLTTITTKAEHCLITPVIERQFSSSTGNSAAEPLGTVTAGGGGKSALVAAYLAKHFGGVTGVGIDTPYPTITTRGTQNQIVTAHLTRDAGTGHGEQVRAFLMKYYSEGGQWQALNEPMHTIHTKARMGLVMVKGQPYQIVDIGMRMLEPHELFAAQGFPADYIMDRDGHGQPITKTQQVAKCGNSVCPPLAEALVRANMGVTAMPISAAA